MHACTGVEGKELERQRRRSSAPHSALCLCKSGSSRWSGSRESQPEGANPFRLSSNHARGLSYILGSAGYPACLCGRNADRLRVSEGTSASVKPEEWSGAVTVPGGCKGDQSAAGQAWLSAEGLSAPFRASSKARVRCDRDRDGLLRRRKLRRAWGWAPEWGSLTPPLRAFSLRSPFAGRCPRKLLRLLGSGAEGGGDGERSFTCCSLWGAPPSMSLSFPSPDGAVIHPQWVCGVCVCSLLDPAN